MAPTDPPGAAAERPHREGRGRRRLRFCRGRPYVSLLVVICHPETTARSSRCVAGGEPGVGDAVGVALGGGVAADCGQEGLPV